jgi:hypothetical protein
MIEIFLTHGIEKCLAMNLNKENYLPAFIQIKKTGQGKDVYFVPKIVSIASMGPFALSAVQATVPKLVWEKASKMLKPYVPTDTIKEALMKEGHEIPY